MHFGRAPVNAFAQGTAGLSRRRAAGAALMHQGRGRMAKFRAAARSFTMLSPFGAMQGQNTPKLLTH